MKKLISLILGILLILTVMTGCSSKKTNKETAASESGKSEKTETADTENNENNEKNEKNEEKTSGIPGSEKPYGEEIKIGETWKVDGLWEVTITGVTESKERSKASDKEPKVVYDIAFTVKNIGYTGEVMKGLYVNMTGNIIDSKGDPGYIYPDSTIDMTKTPLPVTKGETGEFVTAIGLDNSGLPIKLLVNQLGADNTAHEVTFIIDKVG